MKYLSVCSGIEAASAAWHDFGWTPVAFSEVEPFPSAVLAQRFPGVPNLGDMTKYREWPDADVDVLVGGTPCQSFSIAGLRKGLDDPRGSLMLTFLGIAERYRPRYIVWENVPGVMSSNGGRDFGSFLGALGNLGYGWAYRILDAQWFGLAQRRRRVFVVASLGDQRSAAQVLFESEGVCRNPAPRRAAREGSATGSARGTFGGGGLGTDAELDRALIASTGPVSRCLNAAFGEKQGLEDQHALGGAGLFVPAVVGALTAKGPCGLGAPEVDANHYVISSGQPRAEGFDASEDGTGRETPLVPVAFHPTQDPISSTDGTTHAMGTGSKGGVATVAVAAAMQVRRLTPRECERLQGFPDGWTAIQWRGKPAAECPDGPRYKAIGNSMAVPCMRWIGRRIAKVSACDSL